MTAASVACRSCASPELVHVLSLGETPLANALLTAEDVGLPEARFPLTLAMCPQCSLVQITETIPPEQLFSNYPYFSSFSDTMLQHASELAEHLVATRALSSRSLVVEVASNDGYLLQFYKRSGVPVLGIEPAANVAAVAERERGIPTLVDFFGTRLAERLVEEGRRADVLHAHNVLAHVPDLNGFVEGMKLVLDPFGVAVVEVPYLKDMLDRCEFDTIYHEHLSYFSLTALQQLVSRHGLIIVHAERVPIHGGSLRLLLSREDAGRQPSPTVVELLEDEASWGVSHPTAYQDFARRVQDVKRQLLDLLHGLKAQGRRIAAYGASAKGSTLLNYCNVGRDTLEFVVDRSNYKQGRFTPGTHLPIYPPAKLLEARPDYVLLLTWNFADEIMAQQSAYRAQGGRFVIPVPRPAVV